MARKQNPKEEWRCLGGKLWCPGTGVVYDFRGHGKCNVCGKPTGHRK